MATNFYLDGRTNSKGENALRLSVNICGERFVTSCGLLIYPRNWNQDTQTAKSRRSLDPVNSKGHTSARINGEIAKIAAYWQRIEATATERPEAGDLREMWNTFRGKETAPKKAAALALLDGYAASEGKMWSEGTRTKWDSFRGIINDSGIYYSSEHLADPDKAAAFLEYMREGRGLKETTAGKYFSMLCRVIKTGEKKGQFPAGSFDTLAGCGRFTKIKQPVIYLTRAELLRFLDFDPSTVSGKVYMFDGRRHQLNAGTLSRVKDIFCFCALSSLRVSDALALTWGAVDGDKIHITTQKTSDTLKIDLNTKAKAILERRRAESGDTGPGAKVFDPVGIVTMNEYLKVWGWLCGVTEPIARTFIRGGRKVTESVPKYSLLSSHAARKTFIVTALSLGVPPAVVMKFTGHSNFDAMRPYIDITDTAQAEAMKKFDTI